MRFTGQRAGQPFNPLAKIESSESPRVVFRNLDTETTIRSLTDVRFPAPSEDAATAGWTYFLLPRGSYYLALNTSLADLSKPGQGLRFVVSDQSTVTYIGTFLISCSGDESSSPIGTCEPQARIDDESAAAAEVAAKNFAAVGPFVTEIATAYGAPGAADRLPASTAPDIAFTGALWRLRREQDEPRPKPRSTSSSGGGSLFSGGGGNGCSGDPRGCGALLLAILVVAGTIYAVEQIDKALAEPERKPCTDALRQWVPTEKLKPLLTGFSVDEDKNPAADSGSLHWGASVSRVMLRQCMAGDTYGVEVAARWRATESGGDRARFDAILVRAPQSPASDQRVPHPWDRNTALPPWEVSMPASSPCRPLAEYCAANSSDLVLQDIADGLEEMRAWLIDPSARSPSASLSAVPAAMPARRAPWSPRMPAASWQ
jgi:hypothetical protein